LRVRVFRHQHPPVEVEGLRETLEHPGDPRRDRRVLGESNAACRRVVHEELGGDVEDACPPFLRALQGLRALRLCLVREGELASPLEGRDVDRHGVFPT
jgi:hypothetical protein